MADVIAALKDEIVRDPWQFSSVALPVIAGLATFAVRSFTQRRLAFSNYGTINDDYRGLRNLALSFKPGDLGLPSFDDPSAAYGVVVDWGRPSGIATLTGFSSGDASIYFSSGGGVLGGVGHKEVREAAKTLVAEARKRLPLMSLTTDYPLPSIGRARFFVLTPSGVFTTYVRTGPTEPAFAALWNAAQRLFQATSQAKPDASDAFS